VVSFRSNTVNKTKMRPGAEHPGLVPKRFFSKLLKFVETKCQRTAASLRAPEMRSAFSVVARFGDQCLQTPHGPAAPLQEELNSISKGQREMLASFVLPGSF
jgi:hypothetical protein